jgi:hypothetical protein
LRAVSDAFRRIEDYLAAERNRQRHVAELQDRLGLRPSGTRPAADLAGWLLRHAIENDRLVHLQPARKPHVLSIPVADLAGRARTTSVLRVEQL